MKLPFPISSDFQALITGFEGGREWLERLPSLLARCTERWSLELEPPFELSYNYVCPATRKNGDRVVLKVGLVHPEFVCEQAALRIFNGEGCVRLLDTITNSEAFLLEYLHPGHMLTEIQDDEKAVEIAAEVMGRLWKPASEIHDFPTTHDWAAGLARLRRRFKGATGPFPRRMVETAERLFNDLLASQADPVLLHGDLHHYNILYSDNHGWLALDPKGIVGEPAYEIGAYLRNPNHEALSNSELKALTIRRIDQFSEILGMGRDRLIGWCYAQAVLSAWWSYEDNEVIWDPMLRLAEVLQVDIK